MAYDYPEAFFAPRRSSFARRPPMPAELARAAALLRDARRPLIVAGGGVLYGGAATALRALRRAPRRAGGRDAGRQGRAAVGPSAAASARSASPARRPPTRWRDEADLVLAVGTRLQDFTTGSHSLFAQAQLRRASTSTASTRASGTRLAAASATRGAALAALSRALGDWRARCGVDGARADAAAHAWRDDVARAHRRERDVALPYDGDVIGAVQRSAADSPTHDIVVCAAGTLPGELHKLWRTAVPGGYHVEYGYSCMGYEIAGGLGVKMARPEREVIVLVGDGSYLMLNSEIATSVMLGLQAHHRRARQPRLRLHRPPAAGVRRRAVQQPAGRLHCGRRRRRRDRLRRARRALGARAENVADIAELEAALARARAADRTYVIASTPIRTQTTEEGGCWWEVAVPEVSARAEVRAARERLRAQKQAQRP